MWEYRRLNVENSRNFGCTLFKLCLWKQNKPQHKLTVKLTSKHDFLFQTEIFRRRQHTQCTQVDKNYNTETHQSKKQNITSRRHTMNWHQHSIVWFFLMRAQSSIGKYVRYAEVQCKFTVSRRRRRRAFANRVHVCTVYGSGTVRIHSERERQQENFLGNRIFSFESVGL